VGKYQKIIQVVEVVSDNSSDSHVTYLRRGYKSEFSIPQTSIIRFQWWNKRQIAIFLFRNGGFSLVFFFYAIQWRVTDPFVRFNLFLIHFINLDAAAAALRRTLANDLHRRVFWSHHVRHRVVNTYFRLVRTRSTEFYLAAADRNEIPRRCAPAKIPFRGPRLAGAWLNRRSVAGIRSSLQRIEFLSQLSTRSLLSVRLRTSPPRKFRGNRLNAAAAPLIGRVNLNPNVPQWHSDEQHAFPSRIALTKTKARCHSNISCLECGIIKWVSALKSRDD